MTVVRTGWGKASSCGTAACVEVNFDKTDTCGAGTCVEVGFTTASRCATQTCVEVGFTTASRCSNSTCVEVGFTGDDDVITINGDPVSNVKPGDVLVRDSKHPETVISYTPEQWVMFLDRVRHYNMDWPYVVDGDYLLPNPEDTKVLRFTRDEWEAFHDGVTRNEFEITT